MHDTNVSDSATTRKGTTRGAAETQTTLRK